MKLTNLLVKLLPIQTVYAHCDIPCGIYDPSPAQIAAHTILRMTGMLMEEKADMHKIARVTRVKEQHSEALEHELGTLEDDYFKEEHFKAHQDLKELFEKTVKLGAKARQGIDEKSAQELLETVLKIAEIFWKTKGYESARLPAPYPTGGEIVVPVKKI
jgi:nickel superoxide dismutase